METKRIEKKTIHRWQHKTRILKKMLCKFCGNYFWAGRIDAYFCDNTCGQAYRRNKRKF